MTEAYPLQWPPGWPRTKRPERARFDTPFYHACRGILDELRMMGASHVVISTNVALRRDGLPYANQRDPDDRGVAVYFMKTGKQQCIPCDRWDRTKDNLQAIRKTIEALRGLDRWGAKSMVDAAFRGFEALPAPGAVKPCHVVLGIDAVGVTRSDIVRAYRTKARERHPDAGGSNELMAELTAARDEALRRFDVGDPQP